MTNPPKSPTKSLITRCVVIANIECLREDITKELKQHALSKTTHRKELQNEIDEQFQREISRLTVLLQRTERLALGIPDKNYRKLGELNNLVNSLKIGVSTLFGAEPNIELSRQIRLTVEQEIIRNENPPGFRFVARRFSYAWHSPSTPLKVIHGLFLSFIIIFGGLFSFTLLQYIALEARKSVINYESLEPTLSPKINALEPELETKGREVIEQRKKVENIKSNFNVLNFQEKDSVDTPAQPIVDYSRQKLLLDQESEKLKILEREQNRMYAELATLKRKLKSSEPGAIQYFLKLFHFDISKPQSQFLWVAAAGTLGSIISILIRVVDGFHDRKYQDRLMPFFIGFFKPVIGASFGMLFLAIYNSDFVNIPAISRGSYPSAITPPAPPSGVGSNSATANTQPPVFPGAAINQTIEKEKEQKETFFLFAIAFVVGFSERLAKDTISKIDGTNAETDKPNSSSTYAPRIVVIHRSKPRSQNPNSKQSASNHDEASTKQVEPDRS